MGLNFYAVGVSLIFFEGISFGSNPIGDAIFILNLRVKHKQTETNFSKVIMPKEYVKFHLKRDWIRRADVRSRL